jgi:hypothetical protein
MEAGRAAKCQRAVKSSQAQGMCFGLDYCFYAIVAVN